MGLRGPMPTERTLRIVKGQRARRRSVRQLPATSRAKQKAWIEKLRETALKFLEKAEKRPTVHTKNNGEQMSPLLRAVLALNEQADRCEGRYARWKDGEGPVTETGAQKDELDAFRKKKTI